MTFSLLDEPWIPCVLENGEQADLGIRQVFDGSNPVKEVRADSPVQTYALVRLLLAIYWRAHGPEMDADFRDADAIDAVIDWYETQQESARNNSPDEAVLEYLKLHEDRFDLLHPETPFMQVADLATQSGGHSQIQRIVPEAENEYFTMRAGEARSWVGFGEAARWVVYTQAFDYSGIKSGALGDPRVKGGRGYPIGTGWTGMTGGTLVVGANLRETLVLNTVWKNYDPGDQPSWERPQDSSEQRDNSMADSVVPRGASDLATWQSRRIKLFVVGDKVTGVLVSNGDKIPDAGANLLDDPMTPHRYSANKSKKGQPVYYPRPYGTERTMWRSLSPLISIDGDLGFTPKDLAPKRPKTLTFLADLSEQEPDLVPKLLKLELFSVEYGPKGSSVATVVHYGLDLPIALFFEEKSRAQRRKLLDAAKSTNDAAVALGSFAGQLLVAAGGEYEFQPYPTDTALGILEPRFLTWLSHLNVGDMDNQIAEWQKEVRQTILEQAAVLVKGAGPKALVGRITDSGEKVHIQSASTAMMWLRKKLKEALPLAFESEDQNREEKENDR
ncbi:type I-E CRISPR-associated protein Cse1/CasA [Corynebacterium vitaeruminis]|uniref:type I-E CRISPR-associated protein Cse1/CasA n=1 Tax=Corynebacterium vitaeruminis TaxID=38305 RepID=UPI0005541FD6|nr:type I-E CRISPR-associated protein Cse1/CasA [Corynebacterium vitaeruminis]